MKTTPFELFLIFLRLGLTSFGGPIAHLGYFRDEFVTQRQWLTDQYYADLVALCQFLPGPASSQVGIAIGLSQCGYRGAVAAWLGFTLPSALMLLCCALVFNYSSAGVPVALITGLKILAAAVVIQAVLGMAKNLCTDAKRIAIMLIATLFLVLVSFRFNQLLVLACAGLAGYFFLSSPAMDCQSPSPNRIGKMPAMLWLSGFFILLVGLPALILLWDNTWLVLTDSYFRTGALVFGGGHVVLPLLQQELVVSGQMSSDTFLAGYGFAQMVPGPLFTFAAYLGAITHGWLGGVVALLAIFIPGFLLVFGIVPFWHELAANKKLRNAVAGVNASVIGLLAAALINPILTTTLLSFVDLILLALAVTALLVLRWPVWVLAITVVTGALVYPVFV